MGLAFGGGETMYDIKYDRKCRGFSVFRMGIGSWVQYLAAMYENASSPKLLTLGGTKERTLFLVS